MTVSFRDRDTEALAGGQGTRRFANIVLVARRKLRQLKMPAASMTSECRRGIVWRR